MTFEAENSEGARRLEKLQLRFRLRRLIAGIACLSAAVSVLVASALLSWYDWRRSQTVPPEPFNAFSESRDCSIQIQLLAGPFASSQDDKQNFYWGYGLMMEPVIVCFTGELPKDCQMLLDYTSGQETEAVPAPVVLRGRSSAIEYTDLFDYAIDFYQSMWGLEPMNRNEFKETVASCYLDFGKRGWIKDLPDALVVSMFLLPLVLLFSGIKQFRRFWMEKKNERLRLARLTEEEMLNAVRQMGNADEFEPGSRVYLTADFVITGNFQFDIIPYDMIVSLDEVDQYLVAVTVDGTAHIILSSGRRGTKRLSRPDHLKRVLEDKIRYAQT